MITTKKKAGLAALTPWLLYGAIFAACLLLFAHPDIVETANHARVLLDCLFDGRFFDFYETVAAHENTLYYINNANYNIAFYLVFALWELPVYLLGRLFSATAGERLLWLWAKALPALCGVLNAWLVKKLLEANGAAQDAREAAAALLLNPLAFFIPVVMGQYETVCVAVILWALLYYSKGDMPRFCLLMGVAALFKSFALLLVLPLLLLADKKLPRILRDLALCAAPTLLTGLLFRGRMADASAFTDIMTGRLFAQLLWGRVPVFPLALALLCVWCWLKKAPEEGRARLESAAAVGLAVFGALLLMIEWHPQWLYLFLPFWVLCVYLGGNKTLYYYLTPLLSAGAFLYFWNVAPGHLEANLLYFGATGALLECAPVISYIRKIPALYCVATALVYAALGAVLFAQLPLHGQSLAARAAQSGVTPAQEKGRLWLWADFAAGCGFWTAGVLLALLKSGAL